MIPLSTPVPVAPWPGKLRYGDKILLVGSCFTSHIGGRLERYLYDATVNPFGILYNPASIARCLERVADRQWYEAGELVLHDGLYHSMDHHGAFSGPDAGRVLAGINEALLAAHSALAECKSVFISPGTAYIHTYKPTQAVAGNCHKIPSAQFTRERMTPDACADFLARIYQVVRTANPTATICWTVSPVRHLRDGLHENQLSKASLLLGIESVMARHPDTAYFPAYEILHDELRDYRYYDTDMAHPSSLAADIIWDRFVSTCLHPDDIRHHPEIEKIRKAAAHRFLHEDKAATREFARRQLERIETLSRDLPDCHWQPLRMYFFRMTEPD